MCRGKKISCIAAAFLILSIVQWHTVYAAESTSQLQPATSTEVSEEDTNELIPDQSTSATESQVSEASDQDAGGQQTVSSDQKPGGDQTDVSNQNTDEQLTNASGQNEGEQTTDSVKQDTGEQSEASSGQDINGQMAESTDQNMDEQKSDGLQNDEIEMEAEDDDAWADGDDEWTDAWSGGADDMADTWADDGGDGEDENEKAVISSTGSMDEPGAGEKKYIAKHTAPEVSANNMQQRPDRNYQTGAGLGDDLFLILALLCGMAAIALVVRKNIR